MQQKWQKTVLSFLLRIKLENPILCNVLITLKMACKVLIKRFLKFSPFVTIRKWSNIDRDNSILSNEIGRRLRDCQQTNSGDCTIQKNILIKCLFSKLVILIRYGIF